MRGALPRILVTGFMGAGKTTVAGALALRLGCEMYDLDQLIIEREGSTPRELIDERGEAQFRAIESEALAELLSEKSARVIALGGGTWTIEENRRLVAERGGLVVWLDAPFELCWRRISLSAGERPLARSREEAFRLFKARRALYGLAALRLEVKESSPANQLAAEIIRLVDASDDAL